MGESIRVMKIATRPAIGDDVPGIRFVGYSAWPPAYGTICGPEWVVEGLDRYWADSPVRAAVAAGNVCVAVADDMVVGVSEVGEFEDRFMMWKLYVLPRFQHEGVGTALLKAVRQRAAREGRVLHTEYVAANEPAGGFYRSHGFVAVSTPSGPLDSVWIWMRDTGQ